MVKITPIHIQKDKAQYTAVISPAYYAVQRSPASSINDAKAVYNYDYFTFLLTTLARSNMEI